MQINLSNNYRRIWEECFGPIPRDSDGRKFDIHHLDGNRSNNSILNLRALSIRDHYDIHYNQGDYGACLKISMRLKVTPETLSEVARKHNQAMIEKGIHPFIRDKEISKQRLIQRTQEGKNPFSGGQIQRQTQIKRAKAGTHNWVSSDKHISNKKLKCKYCDHVNNLGNITRHHNENCKHKHC